MIYMLVAYALIALMLVGYGISLVRRTREAERALRALDPD